MPVPPLHFLETAPIVGTSFPRLLLVPPCALSLLQFHDNFIGRSVDRNAKAVARVRGQPVGLCNWDHYKCQGAGPLHKCAYCCKPQMHPACHATCGLPDGVNSADELPEGLRGLAPTCCVFCQLVSLNEVIGTGGKTKEVVRMERLWKQKLMRAQKEIKVYQVCDGGTPPAYVDALQYLGANPLCMPSPSVQHSQ